MEPAVQQEPKIVRVIRCTDTGRYLGADRWVMQPSAAYPFQNTDEAIQVCVEHGLINVELEVRSNGSLFSVPIR